MDRLPPRPVLGRPRRNARMTDTAFRRPHPHAHRGIAVVPLALALTAGPTMATTPAAAAPPPAPTVELWPQGAPGARGTSDEDRPAVTAYLPAPGTSTGA